MIRSVCSITKRVVLAETLIRTAIESRSTSNFSIRCYHHHRPLRHPLRSRREMTIRRGSSSPLPPTEQKFIRLSKRMGELDMFSRREADRLILDGRVLVDGNLVEVGHNVPSNLEANQIEIINSSGPSSSLASRRRNQNHLSSDNTHIMDRMTAVVLNKPKGYVSGQAEHGHPPAIRLLTSRNRMWGEEDQDQEIGDNDSNNSSYDGRHRRRFYNWKGFAPAGRLDLDSTGILVFTKNGVLAKKLIGEASSIEKEYIVDVEPAVYPTKRELSMDPNFVLPSFSSEQQRYDLAPFLEGGGHLIGDNRPLKACPDAGWIVKGEKLRLVLTEGRKHQIRRMCRELLGFHVVGLHRIRIGPIALPNNESEHKESSSSEGTLPKGCWRPLRQNEIEFLLPNIK